VGAILRLMVTRGEFGCYDSMFESSGGELFSRGAVVSAATSHAVESHVKVDRDPKDKVNNADIAIMEKAVLVVGEHVCNMSKSTCRLQ
jgi:hypothetical protein